MLSGDNPAASIVAATCSEVVKEIWGSDVPAGRSRQHLPDMALTTSKQLFVTLFSGSPWNAVALQVGDRANPSPGGERTAWNPTGR